MSFFVGDKVSFMLDEQVNGRDPYRVKGEILEELPGQTWRVATEMGIAVVLPEHDLEAVK